MKRKVFSLILASMTILSLTACGGNASVDSSAQKDSTTEAKTETETKKETGKKVVYWSMWNETEPQGQTIKLAIEEFKQTTGIDVEINWQGREIRKTLQSALDANQTIDVFDEDIDRVNTTWGDYLLPLDEFVTKEYSTTNGKAYKECINQALINVAAEVGGGSIKTIPYQPNVFAVFYNKDIFDKAGVTAVPKTWEEFLATCEKIKTAGFTPITVDDAYMDCLPGYHLARLVGQDGVIDIVNNKDWDNPAVLKMAQDWEDMYKKGYISEFASSNVWPAAQLDEIAGGTAAMYLNGSWLPNEIKDTAGEDFRWGTFSYPAVDGGVNGPEAANFGAQVFAVNKNTQVADEAFQLIAWLTTGKWDTELATSSMGVPMDLNATWPEQLAEAKDVFNSLTTRYTWAAGIETNTDVLPTIVSNFTKLISGGLTADQFVAEMKK